MRFLHSLAFALIFAAFFAFYTQAKPHHQNKNHHHNNHNNNNNNNNNIHQLHNAVFSHTTPSETDFQSLFRSFMNHYSKSYSHEEFFSRFIIFKNNIEKIRYHNTKGKSNYIMDINEFTDLTAEEFKGKYYGLKTIKNDFLRSKNYHDIIDDAPAAVDWRDYGAVTAVKNQGICGACWSFSATGAIEGAYVLQGKHQLISFSEQQLLDCSQSYGTYGCNGGFMDQAFQYIIATGGLCTENDYPYINTTHLTCNTSCTKIAKLTGYIDVPVNETALLNAVGTIGPVSVGIEADQSVFQFYSKGIINDPSCGTELDHGVLVVGYGTENGQDYWIVKNSWGSNWGESGYVRLARNVNQCGISQKASYPTL